MPPFSGSVTPMVLWNPPLMNFLLLDPLVAFQGQVWVPGRICQFSTVWATAGFSMFSTIEFGAGQLFIVGDWLERCRMFLTASLSSMHKMPLSSLTWDIPDCPQALPNVQNWNPLDNSDWLGDRACNSSWSNPSQLWKLPSRRYLLSTRGCKIETTMDFLPCCGKAFSETEKD